MGNGSSAFTMKERKEPKFVTFTDGEVVEGVLIAIQAIEMKDKQTGDARKVTRFVLAEGEVDSEKGWIPNGDSVCFLGTYQLNASLLMTDRGRFVSVRCEGMDPNVSKNGNPMKRFKVFVSGEIAMQVGAKGKSGALEITDDDIPF